MRFVFALMAALMVILGFTTTYAEDVVTKTVPPTVQETEGTPEFSTGSLFATFLTSKLGTNKRTHVYSTNNNTRFFYEPALFPEWSSYEQKVNSVCKGKKDDIALNLNERIFIDNELDRERSISSTRTSGVFSVEEIVRNDESADDLQKLLLRSSSGDLRKFTTAIRSQIQSYSKSTQQRIPFQAMQSDNFRFQAMTLGPAKIKEDIPNVFGIEKNKYKISLKIIIDDKEYRQQIVESINAHLSTKTPVKIISDINLHVIPYDIVRIKMHLGGRNKIIYASDPEYKNYADKNYSRAKSFALDRFIEVDLDEDCDIHLQVVAEKNSGKRNLLSGELYRSGAIFSKFSLFFSSGVGVVERFKAALFTDESTIIESKSTGSASGASISIPLIGGGGGGSSTSTTSLSAQRLVSRDVLDSAVKKAIAGTSAYCTGGANGCLAAMTKLIDAIISDGIGKASLVRAEDGKYQVIKDQISYFTIKDSAINSKLDSKFKSIVDKKSTAAVGDGKDKVAVDGSLKTDTALDVAGDIGTKNIPVAVTGDLSVVSEEIIDELIEFELTNRIPVEGVQRFFFPFHYPSLGYRDDKISTAADDLVYRKKVLEEALLKKQCSEGVFSHSRKIAGQKNIRGSKPRTWTNPVTAVARPGFYIVSGWNSIITSSHNGQGAQTSAPKAHAENVHIGGKDHMFQTVSYRYYCKRGRKPFRKRSCRASGYVDYVEQPVKCAPYLIQNYAAAKLATGQ